MRKGIKSKYDIEKERNTAAQYAMTNALCGVLGHSFPWFNPF